jgi:outer membrane protein assembly factor BamB
MMNSLRFSLGASHEPRMGGGSSPFSTVSGGGRPSLLGFIFALTTSLALGAAADWPQFRGRDGSGAIADAVLPIALDRKAHLKWEIALPGRGLSSPIIIGDRLFVTCSSGPRQARLHVICFRSGDGAKVWERQFFATGRTQTHEKTSIAAPSPVSDGQRVFAIFSCNDLFALDLQGNLLWLRGLTLDYPNVSNSLGMSSSLVYAGDTVIAQVENDSQQSYALGIDADSGVNRWRLDRPNMANWTSPLVFRDPGTGRQLVALQSGKGLLAIEPATGAAVWNYAEGASTIPSTALAAGVFYVPSHGLTALRPGAPGDGPKMLWRASALRPGMSTPLVIADRVFTINDASVLTCGSAQTGERLWQLRLKGPFSSSPLAAGQFIYAVNEKGLLQVINTAKHEGEVVSELDLADTILSTPAISGDALYLRSDGKLWKICGS